MAKAHGSNPKTSYASRRATAARILSSAAAGKLHPARLKNGYSNILNATGVLHERQAAGRGTRSANTLANGELCLRSQDARKPLAFAWLQPVLP